MVGPGRKRRSRVGRRGRKQSRRATQCSARRRRELVLFGGHLDPRLETALKPLLASCGAVVPKSGWLERPPSSLGATLRSRTSPRSSRTR